MLKSQCLLISVLLVFLFFDGFTVTTTALRFKDVEEEEESDVVISSLVTKDERKTVTETEFGQISSVDISDYHGSKGTKHHLQFITLEPNSLFLPVLLHADMVFYVQTGSGSLSWVDEDGNKNQFKIQRGDIYRLHSGSVFHIRSNLESKREKLRIYAIFTQKLSNGNPQKLLIGAYSKLNDLVLGFDKKVLQTAFNVPEEVLEEITRAEKPPAIIHLSPKGKMSEDSEQASWKAGIIETIVGGGESYEVNKKKKKSNTFNILEKKPDVENCNGWSLAVNKKDFPVLKGSDIGVFMVNLTQGSMMGPHWNPRASEIGIVIHGQGMIRVVCSSSKSNESSSGGCKNVRFRVGEGDVFVIPRFHPMAQMSYNNDSLVFMGFTTMARTNHPQFLAGERSVLRSLDRDVLAMAFNVRNVSIDRLLGAQVESVILGCVNCAEEEEKIMQKEIEKEEEERAREKEREEEERRREQEEEEEARRQEEEKQAREKKEEEERRRREEEEEAQRREEEKAEKEAKEEKKRREEEEEEAQRREEEKAEERKKREEEEEEAQRREEEEAEERKRREEEEEAQRREEEEAEERKRREEEEAQRREEEAEERKRREEEEEAAAERREEEERERGGGKGRRILKM